MRLSALCYALVYMPPLTLLVLDHPAAPHLRLLERLPDSTLIAAGDRLEAFTGSAAEADAVLVGLGMSRLLDHLLPMAPRLRWVHSFSAGVEHIISPRLVESPAILTNGRGAFSWSLGEFALASILFFAKDLRRMVHCQEAGRWDPFDVEPIRGKVLGVAGYGDIGRAAAERARAFGMKILACRRRPELCGADPLIDGAFSVDQRAEMLALCDYVLCAMPLTPETRGLIGPVELAAMKSSAVLINVGRGPVVVESALVEALEQRRIRGAALDVFDEEPLAEGHPFWRLPNVLLSPHCADHTPGWQDLGMEVFLRNFDHFAKGEPLENVVDKTKGY